MDCDKGRSTGDAHGLGGAVGRAGFVPLCGFILLTRTETRVVIIEMFDPPQAATRRPRVPASLKGIPPMFRLWFSVLIVLVCASMNAVAQER